MPITSCPARRISAATTEESTPPDMATTTRRRSPAAVPTTGALKADVGTFSVTLGANLRSDGYGLQSVLKLIRRTGAVNLGLEQGVVQVRPTRPAGASRPVGAPPERLALVA